MANMSFHAFQISIPSATGKPVPSGNISDASEVISNNYSTSYAGKSVNHLVPNPKGSFGWDCSTGRYGLHWKSWVDMEAWIRHEEEANTFEFV